MSELVSETWTTLKVLDWTTGRFERAGVPSPRLDAQILLAHSLKCSRVDLYAQFDRPLAPEELAAYRTLIQQRLGGQPVAYLTGEKEFWSLSFQVDPRVLIPRPDTETLVQLALELGDKVCESEGKQLQILEVSTGSGAISVALATERPDWNFVATDLSEDALAVARENAKRHEVDARIAFHQGDLLNALPGAAGEGHRFHLLVANLPYLSKAEMSELDQDVQAEPSMALLGGEKGTELIDRLLEQAPGHLQPGAWVALEHGYAQDEAVQELFAKHAYTEIETRPDLAGNARVTFARSPSER